MAELPEWSAQVLRHQGSDGPVKVMYFRSRLEVTNDSLDQNFAWPKERTELSKQISAEASWASDSGDVFLRHLFNDPVEILNSKNFELEWGKWFEDNKSALEDIASKLNNFPRVFPFPIESSYGIRYLYIGPGKTSEEDDILWDDFKARATTEKHLEPIQDFKPIEDLEVAKESESDEESESVKPSLTVQDFPTLRDFELYQYFPGRWRRRREEEGGENKKKREKKKEEKKEEKETIENDEKKKLEDEKRRRLKTLEKRKELDGMVPRDKRRGHRCQCALLLGITTEFNPSGIWIVEDILYDEEERE